MSGQMGINRTLVKSFWPFRTPSNTMYSLGLYCRCVVISIDEILFANKQPFSRFCFIQLIDRLVRFALPGLGQHV